MTALTVYLSSTSDSGGALATANKLLTTSGTVTTVSSAQLAKSAAGGWVELYAQGGSTAYLGSEPAPSGNGFVFDAATLDGQTLAAGTWTASILLGAVATGFTVTPRLRVFKYSTAFFTYTQLTSGGTATDMVSTSRSLTTSQVAATFSQAFDSTDFAAGDMLYADVILDVTAGSTSTTAANRVIKLSENGGAGESAVTPGYAPTVTTWALAGTATAVTTGDGALALAPAALAGTAAAASAASGAVTVPVTLTNGAEGLANGTGATTANTGGASGDAADAITTSATCTLTSDNAHAAHGTQSYKYAYGATAGNLAFDWAASMGAQPQAWFRLYLYFTANPPANLRIWGAKPASGICGHLDMTSTGKLAFYDAAGAAQVTSTASIPLNAWFRVEGFLTGSATAGQVEFELYTTPDGTTAAETQASGTTVNTNAPPSAYVFGDEGTAVASFTYWADDLGLSNIGPLGPAGGGGGTVTLAGTAVAPAAAGGNLFFAPAAATGTAVTAAAAAGGFTPAALAGTAVAASGASGALREAMTLSGTAPGGSAAAGMIALTLSLAGTGAVASGASGAITPGVGPVTWQLGGSSAQGTAASGALAFAPAVLTGAASAGSGGAGLLSVRAALAGAAAEHTSASGAFVAVAWVLGGSAAAALPAAAPAGTLVILPAATYGTAQAAAMTVPRAAAGQMTPARAQAAQMTVPHAEGGTW